MAGPVLAGLTTEQLRILRDDRAAITDEVYRIIEQPINEFELRSQVYAHLSNRTAEAFNENLQRVTTPTKPEESGQ
ncbi:hypothetical protein [Microbacterium sp. K24]|uniref:hypothetical protein n=1 Tax=Microbacterium sp. K24 TaxID=2305446 RepID=UPI00109C8562|nr:hypothetical protein [Microbacterium sp. K24]